MVSQVFIFQKILKSVLILQFLAFSFYVLLIYKKKNSLLRETIEEENCGVYGCIDDYLDFEGFDNEKGVNKSIVPNIVHLVYLNETKIKFYQMICIFSIYFNHKPELIYFHCDNCSFHGQYWEKIKSHKSLWDIIKIHKIPFNNRIFGKKYGWVEYHRSDVWRLQVLMNYGGFYFDNDVYVIQSLQKYRKYEMTLEWNDKKEGIGCQILIAHRNARLLKAHFDSYRSDYKRTQWYYNAGMVSGNVLRQHSNLSHIVRETFGSDPNHFKCLFYKYCPNWRKNLEAVHTLVNHRDYLDKNSTIKEFDEFNIINYNYTFGEMCREILLKIDKN